MERTGACMHGIKVCQPLQATKPPGGVRDAKPPPLQKEDLGDVALNSAHFCSFYTLWPRLYHVSDKWRGHPRSAPESTTEQEGHLNLSQLRMWTRLIRTCSWWGVGRHHPHAESCWWQLTDIRHATGTCSRHFFGWCRRGMAESTTAMTLRSSRNTSHDGPGTGCCLPTRGSRHDSASRTCPTSDPWCSPGRSSSAIPASRFWTTCRRWRSRFASAAHSLVATDFPPVTRPAVVSSRLCPFVIPENRCGQVATRVRRVDSQGRSCSSSPSPSRYLNNHTVHTTSVLNHQRLFVALFNFTSLVCTDRPTVCYTKARDKQVKHWQPTNSYSFVNFLQFLSVSFEELFTTCWFL